MDYLRTALKTSATSRIEALLSEDYGDLSKSLVSPPISLPALYSYMVKGTSEESVHESQVERSWLDIGTSEAPWLSPTWVPDTIWGTDSACMADHAVSHGDYWPGPFAFTQVTGSSIFSAARINDAVSFPVLIFRVPPRNVFLWRPWGLTAEGYDFYLHWRRHSDKSLRHVVDTFHGPRSPRRRAANGVPNRKMPTGLSGLKSRRRPCSARVFVSRRLKRQSRDSADIDASRNRSIDRIWVAGHDQFQGLDRFH
jgi:hypothetical protein